MNTHLLVALCIVLLVVIQVPIQKALAQKESMIGLWTGTTDLQVGYSENGVTVSASGSGRFSFTVSGTGQISGQGTFQGSVTVNVNTAGCVGGGSDSFSETDSYSGQVNFGTGVAVVDVTMTATNAPSSMTITCTTDDGQTITVTEPIPSQMVTVSGQYQWQLTSGGMTNGGWQYVYDFEFPAPLSGYMRVTFTGPSSITRPSISTIEMSTTWRSFTFPSSTTIRSETTEETTATEETTKKTLVVVIVPPYALVARGGWVSCFETIGFRADVRFADGSTPNNIQYEWTTTGGTLSSSDAEEVVWSPPQPEQGSTPEIGAVVATCTISLRATAFDDSGRGYTGSNRKVCIVKYYPEYYPQGSWIAQETESTEPWYDKQLALKLGDWVELDTTWRELGILAVKIGTAGAGVHLLAVRGWIGESISIKVLAHLPGHAFVNKAFHVVGIEDTSAEGTSEEGWFQSKIPFAEEITFRLHWAKFVEPEQAFESRSLVASDISQNRMESLDVDNIELITIELDTGSVKELPVSSIDKAAGTVEVKLDHPCLFTLGIRRVPQTSTTTFTTTTQSPQPAQLDLDLLTRVVVTIIAVLVVAVAAVAAAKRIRSSGRPRLPPPPPASPQITPGTRPFCGYCGAPIRPGALFCESCGKKLA